MGCIGYSKATSNRSMTWSEDMSGLKDGIIARLKTHIRQSKTRYFVQLCALLSTILQGAEANVTVVGNNDFYHPSHTTAVHDGHAPTTTTASSACTFFNADVARFVFIVLNESLSGLVESIGNASNTPAQAPSSTPTTKNCDISGGLLLPRFYLRLASICVLWRQAAVSCVHLECDNDDAQWTHHGDVGADGAERERISRNSNNNNDDGEKEQGKTERCGWVMDNIGENHPLLVRY
jgi:hypothetical protein